MKLSIDRLTTTPTTFEYEGTPQWWREHIGDANDAPYEVAESFAFSLDAHRMGEDVYLEGRMRGELEVECSRCAARYRQPLRESFSLVLEPARSRIPADPESAEALQRRGVCLGDELESGWFRGSEIELDAWFAEIVALAIPVQPLCQPDCSGLCPVCGATRGSAQCGCRPEDLPKRESPFAVLAGLRDGMQGD